MKTFCFQQPQQRWIFSRPPPSRYSFPFATLLLFERKYKRFCVGLRCVVSPKKEIWPRPRWQPRLTIRGKSVPRGCVMVLLLVTFCIELNSALNRNDDTPIEWDTRAGEKDFRWVLTWKERRSGRGSGGRCGMVQFPNDLPGQQKRTDRRRRTGSTKPASMQQQHQQDSSENRYRRYFVCFPWIFKQFYFIVFQIYTAEDDRRTRFLSGTLLRLRCSAQQHLQDHSCCCCSIDCVWSEEMASSCRFFVCRIRLTDVKCQRGRQERKPRLQHWCTYTKISKWQQFSAANFADGECAAKLVLGLEMLMLHVEGDILRVGVTETISHKPGVRTRC